MQFILLFLLYGIGEIVSLCKFSVLLFSSMLPSVCDESRSAFDFVFLAFWDQFIEILNLFVGFSDT